ncbi:MAG: RNA 2'-phosphotransferase [Mitsuokella sp.]|uniref:RNA 2'-phosphotransferase n=1 Tax=Mitsuokella sp. TaxID=2049034 RepID=UPI003F0DE52F
MENDELTSQEVRHSRKIACVLRHHPEQIGIRLDRHGWADVREMLQALSAHGTECSMQELERIVLYNDKKRFAFNEDRTKIRARQGHSIPVDVELKKAVPPAVLYHGTIEPNRMSIEEKGLLPMNRLYVHLSPNIETAKRVAGRRQKKGPILIYEVDAKAMLRDGCTFFLSENGVWLTQMVKPVYLKALESMACCHHDFKK